MKASPLLSIESKINTKLLNETLRDLQKRALYVGIAADSTHDIRDDDGPNNSELGFIHEYGSPLSNIPPRPFLIPGVQSQKAKISEKLGLAMREALDNNKRECDKILEQLGISTAEAVKEYLRTASFEPLKASTIANRYRSRQTKSKRDNEVRYIVGKDGKKAANPNFGKGIQPLINSGALLNSIDSYLIKES
ncbi:MAG TPA: hypothetical protein IAC66_07530 [Candidatus Aphodousia gallistercoris]|nr:hypothetical protein [Candidatus Aphodousia gallistercoris]